MLNRFHACWVVLVFATLACQVYSFGGDVTTSGGVLFQDDFSDTSSGWDRVNLPDGVTDYANGVYRIRVNATNTERWAKPGLSFTDVRIEVDATKIAGDDDNIFGTICRYQDNENFYFFIVSSDGYYGIGKFKNDQLLLIGVDSMPPSEHINQGNTTNHLRSDCVGSTLTMYANGEKLAEFHDSDFSYGDVGLVAGALATPGTDIHFDNFMVLKP